MQSRKMTPNSREVLTRTNVLITGAWPSSHKFVSKFCICTRKTSLTKNTSKTAMSLLQIVGFSASKYWTFFWLNMLLFKSSTLQQYRALLQCNSNPWTLLEVTKQMWGFCEGFKPRPAKEAEEICDRFSFVSWKMVSWYSKFLVFEYCIY